MAGKRRKAEAREDHGAMKPPKEETNEKKREKRREEKRREKQNKAKERK